MPRKPFWQRLARATTLASAAARADRPPTGRALDLAALEARVLFSAGPMPVEGEMVADGADAAGENFAIGVDEPNPLDLLGTKEGFAAGDSLLEAVHTANPDLSPTSEQGDDLCIEVVFIDKAAENYQQLVDDLLSSAGEDRQFNVYLVDSDADGMAQITDVLATYESLDAVHLVSHGTEGRVHLGNVWLDLDRISDQSDELAVWNNALRDSGDLLIYGCDLAASADGRELVAALAAQCDCDVVASDDDTGHTAYGADWHLEFATGTIESSVAFSGQVQEEWLGLLATFTVTNTNDIGIGSLRWAIDLANLAPGPDTINFNIPGAGPHTIQVNNPADGSNGPLPTIIDAVIIDGYTQPGAADNTLPVGSDAVLKIQIDGGLTGDVDGLSLVAGSDGSTIRGLSITGFAGGTNGGEAIDLQSDSNFILGNYLGLAVDGSTTAGNRTAIDIHGGASGNMIGGASPADRNVLSANTYSGVFIRNINSDNNRLFGNYIGLDAAGVTTLIDGSDIGVDVPIIGVELVEADLNVGLQTLNSGQILATFDIEDGSGGVVADRHDIFILTVTSTGATTVATSAVLLDGSQVGLDSNNESISGLTLLDAGTAPINAPPTTVDDNYAVDEDSSLTTDPGPTWFDANWGARQELEFDNQAQAQNLDDFPVLVVLNPSRIDYSLVQGAGQDLRFTDSDGTPLDYEIEDWNPGATSYVWVQVPRIDGGSNTDSIWLYYDNPTAPVGQVPSNVWSTEYKAVWHLNETSGTHFDATANNQNLNQAVGGVGQNANGKIDGADDFDGIDEYLSRTGADAPLQITGDLTLQAWIWLDSYPGNSTTDMGTDAAVVEFGGFGDGDSAENYLYSLVVQNNGDVALGHESGTGSNHFQDMGVSLSLNQWYQLTAVRDAGVQEWSLFVNGSPAGSPFSYATNSNGGGNGAIYIGWDHTYIDGIIDEVRVEDTIRSADWIAAQYASMDNNFVTFGAAQTSTFAGVLANDSDADGDALNAILGTGPSNAQTFSWNPDGSFSYTPLPGFNGIDTFTYRANDGTVDSNLATVTITVNAVNDPPGLGTNTGIAVAEGSTSNAITTAMLNENDPDDDGVELTYTVTSATTRGTLRLSGGALTGGSTFTQDDIDAGRVTYDHGGGENPTDSFGVSLADGGEDGAAAALGTFSITVNAINDRPSATIVASAFGFNEDDPYRLTGGVSVADVDAGANDLSVNLFVNDGDLRLTVTTGLTFTGGTNFSSIMTFTGSITNLNNALATLAYRPDPEYAGADLLTLNVDDLGNTGGGSLVDMDTANIVVTAINDPPTVGTNSGIAVAESSTGNTLTTAMLNENDPDDDGVELTYTVTAVTTNGTLRLSGGALAGGSTFTQDDIDSGRVTYDHGGGENPTDSFGFTLADGGENGVTPDSGIFNISVNPLNDEQSLDVNLTRSVGQGATATISNAFLLTSDVDNTSAQLVYSITSGPANGAVLLSGAPTVSFTQNDINAGRVAYLHDGSPTGSDTFDFDVDDGQGIVTSAAFNLTVTLTNNEESLDVNLPLSLNEGSTSPISNTLLATSDPDTSDDNLVYTITGGGPARGVVLLSGVPSLSFTQQDIDLGRVAYRHDGSDTAADSFTFDVDDGQGAVTSAALLINVTPVNDPPLVGTNTGALVGEGSTGNTITAAMLNENDPDDAGAGVTYTVTGVTGNGTLRRSGAPLGFGSTFTQIDINTGRLTYDHDGSETSSDSFRFSLADGGEDSAAPATGTFSFTIDPINDRPTATIGPASYGVNEDDPLQPLGGVSIADVDAGANTIAVRLSVNDGRLRMITTTGITFAVGSNNGAAMTITGTVTMLNSALGTLSYQPDRGFGGTDVLRLDVDDLGNTGGGALTNTDTATIIVAPVNDPPAVGANTGIAVVEGSLSNVITTAMLNENDPDDAGVGLTYTVTGATAKGTLRLRGAVLVLGSTFTQDDIDAGRLSYDHSGSGTTGDSFGFSIADGGEDGVRPATGRFIIKVSPDLAPPPPAVVPPPDVTPAPEEPPPEDPPTEDPLGDGESEPPITTEPTLPKPPTAKPPVAPPTLVDLPAEADLTTDSADEAAQAAARIFVESRVQRDAGQARAESSDTSANGPAENLRFVVEAGAFWHALDELEQEVDQAGQMQQLAGGAVVGVSSGLTAGYVLWLMRGGYLLSSVLAQMPAWRFIDPLPILDYLEDETEEPGEQDSLAGMLEASANQSDRPDNNSLAQVSSAGETPVTETRKPGLTIDNAVVGDDSERPA